MTTVREAEQIKQQIVEMHGSGLSDKQMSAALGCTVPKIQYHRKQLGLKRYNKKVTDEDRLLIRQLYRDGMTDQAIAERIGYHKTTVNRVIRHSDTSTRNIAQVLQDPINKFLASRWTAETVRNCLV